MKRWMVWTAIISAIIFAAVGFIAPIEAGMSVFGHVLKTIVMWAWVTVILEVLAYFFSQLVYDWSHGYKEKYGKWWFFKGVAEDFRYIRDKWDWKKFWRIVLSFVLFFLTVLGVFAVLELIVP